MEVAFALLERFFLLALFAVDWGRRRCWGPGCLAGGCLVEGEGGDGEMIVGRWWGWYCIRHGDDVDCCPLCSRD